MLKNRKFGFLIAFIAIFMFSSCNPWRPGAVAKQIGARKNKKIHVKTASARNHKKQHFRR